MAKRKRASTGSAWIKKAIKRPGALRRSLGVRKGKRIPAGRLRSAAKKPGTLGRRARFAQMLRSFTSKKRKR